MVLKLKNDFSTELKSTRRISFSNFFSAILSCRKTKKNQWKKKENEKGSDLNIPLKKLFFSKKFFFVNYL